MPQGFRWQRLTPEVVVCLAELDTPYGSTYRGPAERSTAGQASSGTLAMFVFSSTENYR